MGRGRLARIDRWARSLLAPPGTQTPNVAPIEPLQRSEKLFAVAIGFSCTSLISILLLQSRRAWMIPLFTLLCIAVAASVPKRRRRYWLIGIVAALPLQAIGCFFAMGPFH